MIFCLSKIEYYSIRGGKRGIGVHRVEGKHQPAGAELNIKKIAVY